MTVATETPRKLEPRQLAATFNGPPQLTRLPRPTLALPAERYDRSCIQVLSSQVCKLVT